MTYEQEQTINSLIILGVIFLLFLLRNVHPIFKGIWFIVKWFFIVLLATLFASYAKDSIKKWWNN